MSVSTECLRSLIQSDHPISISRQCELLGLPRSSYYYEPARESTQNLELMRLIDQHHLEHPHTGRLGMTQWLKLQGHHVNIKRIRRLMNLMGLTALYPRPRTTVRCGEHKVYPYLLRGVKIERVNQVWSTDITYIPMASGFMYLVAVIDWYSRNVLAWEISNSLEDIYLKVYDLVSDLYQGLTRYMDFYSHQRPHQSLKGQTPASVYKLAN